MKKIFSFLFIAIMLFVVASCSNSVLGDKSDDLADVSALPLFATAQSVNTTVNYSIAKNGSKWLSFPVTSGVAYTLSASDNYGYTGTRPAHVLDLTCYKTESTSGTKLIATWYNQTSDGTTTPDAKSFTANYTGTAFFYLKEINKGTGTASVTILGGTSSSSSSSSSSTSSSSSSTTTQDGTTAAKAYVLSAGVAKSATTTATSQSVWFRINATAGTTYTITPADKSSNSSYTGVCKYYAYSSNGTTAIKFGASAYSYVYSTDAATQRTVKATDSVVYIKAVSSTAGTFTVTYTGGSSTSSSSSTTSSSSSSSTTSSSSSSSSSSSEAALGTYSGKVYVAGNAALVTKTTSYGVVLMGGGSEDDNAMKWMISKAGGGDFVVLRADDPGAASYATYIVGLGGVDSCHEVVVNSTTLANSTYIDNLLRSAEAVFIAGGDQNAYYNYWNGTKVESALLYLANTKKIPIGGTSAGDATMGGVIYTPTGTGTISSEMLANPYNTNTSVIRSDFIAFPLMSGIFNEPHFSEHSAGSRQGRALGFLARIIKDGIATVANAKAIATDECTAVCVDANGLGKVFGSDAYDDYAFFFKATIAPTTCVSGSKLTFTGISYVKVKGTATGANTFNLSTWAGSGSGVTTGTININAGVMSPIIETPN